MAARSAWRGAIQFGPFTLNVAAYNVLRSKSAESFTNLCPCHQQPVVAPKRCAVTDAVVDTDDCLKGVKVGRNDVRVVPNDAVEAIKEGERSTVLEILQMPPADSVPLDLASAHYRLTPDEKVPASDQAVQLMWNGLRKSGQAIITEIVMRAGSRPALVAIVADDAGLLMHAIPYASDVQEAGSFTPVANEQAGDMFAQFAAVQGIDTTPFDARAHVDRYKERRDELVAQALNGESITAPAAGKAEAAGPADLMAAMAAALEAAQPTAKPKSRSKSKAAA
jgi:non-homologous end joining protein Ku